MWLPQTPDLNIMESFWDIQRQKTLRQTKSTRGIVARNNLPVKYIEKLSASVLKRLDAGSGKGWLQILI